MKTLYMTKGLPASGKSTWSKSKVSESPGSYKRLNKDDLRAMLDGGKWSAENEKFLLGVRDYAITAALNAGKHVIVDDTNLAPKHELRLRQLASNTGAAFEVVDFTNVSVEECIKRDQKRPNYVGEKVIRDMWCKFLKKPVMQEERPYDTSLPDCIIVDIDGTMSIMVERSPFDWKRVGEDLPNTPVVGLVQLVDRLSGTEPIFVSGRDECCREETSAWLAKQGFHGYTLFMRPAGDSRDDRIIKQEIYEREIEGKYNVHFILDDRKKVVERWRELGLPCFQVARRRLLDNILTRAPIVWYTRI